MATTMRFRLRTLLLLPAVLSLTIFGAASVPRSETLLNNDRWKGHYTGLGWSQERGIFGKRYFKFTVDDLPRRFWVIHYDGGEFGDAECRYPDGSISLTGRCRVERTETQTYPLIDDLSDATSYTPTGDVAAKVTNGSGSAILFYPDGTKNWETEYAHHQRVRYLHFDTDGSLLADSNHRDGG